MNSEVVRNTVASLDIMWKGMLGLFAVCGVIALLTAAFGILCRKAAKPAA